MKLCETYPLQIGIGFHSSSAWCLTRSPIWYDHVPSHSNTLNSIIFYKSGCQPNPRTHSLQTSDDDDVDYDHDDDDGEENDDDDDAVASQPWFRCVIVIDWYESIERNVLRIAWRWREKGERRENDMEFNNVMSWNRNYSVKFNRQTVNVKGFL